MSMRRALPWGLARIAYIAVEPEVRDRVRQGYPLKAAWQELAPQVSYRSFAEWHARRSRPAARPAPDQIRSGGPQPAPAAARSWDPANLDRDALLGPSRPSRP